MKKFFSNIRFFLIWGINEIYSLKDLRLDTPISLPVALLILVFWFFLLTYFLLF